MINPITEHDFLTDDMFIKWRLFRTDELCRYWDEYIVDNPLHQETLNAAIHKFEAVRLNSRSLPEDDCRRLLARIVSSLAAAQKRRKRRTAIFSAAACLALLIAGAFTLNYLSTGLADTSDMIIIEACAPEDIQLISGSRVLTISGNSDIDLSDNSTISISSSDSETEKIAVTDVVMNKLIVPRGKLSSLTLPDGSRVWINAGSELTFPSSFPANERSISVSGEIYIDVAQDNKRPFFVHTNDFSVKVHGTRFNVSSYSDLSEKSVVLEQGKVDVITRGVPRPMTPGEMMAINNGDISVRKVNPLEYTSWKDGVYTINKMSIGDILKKVGRYYNVEFHDTNSAIMSLTCSGKLSFSGSLEEVIDIVCSISGTEYSREGDIIYIKPKPAK